MYRLIRSLPTRKSEILMFKRSHTDVPKSNSPIKSIPCDEKIPNSSLEHTKLKFIMENEFALSKEKYKYQCYGGIALSAMVVLLFLIWCYFDAEKARINNKPKYGYSD